MTVIVSDAFKAQLKLPHRIATKVEIYTHGVLTTLPVAFIITDGQVSEERDNAIRRRATFTIVDPTNQLLPTDLGDILAPNQNEIRPYRGINLSTGPEYVSLGIFGFTDIQMNDSGGSIAITIEAFDRSSIISRERFTDVYIVASGTSVDSAIVSIIDSRFAGLVYHLSGGTFTTPQLVFDRGSDPWAAATQIAASAGLEVFFDENGEVVIRDVPDPTLDAVKWTYTGDQAATITQVSRKLSAPQYNHVIEIGEGTNIPVPFSASASDNNPTSPTWVGYGDFPTFHVSEFYTDATQCQAAADAKLRLVLGATENIDFNTIPNPALQVGDVITINQPRVKVSNTIYVVDKVTTPMTAAAGQSCSVRQRTIPS